VARLRSFSAAARELRVSPSALSQLVRRLESGLGSPLLVRTTRSLSLTGAGQRLADSAGPAIGQVLHALQEATAKPGEVIGRLRLSIPGLAVQVMAELIAKFHERHPHIEVEARVEDRLVDIVAGGYDAGVRLSESIQRDMVQVRLTGAFRFVVVGAPAYLRKRGVPQRPRDLVQHDCICTRSSTTFQLMPWDLERNGRTVRVAVRGPIATNDARLMEALARAGSGLAYISEETVRPPLRIVLEEWAPRVPGFFLYFPSRAQVSPVLRAFVDFVRHKNEGPVR
jgi:DNA-binding transcriptional LysR family regulator